MTEEALKERRRYHRDWKRDNTDKTSHYQDVYWQKSADRMRANLEASKKARCEAEGIPYQPSTWIYWSERQRLERLEAWKEEHPEPAPSGNPRREYHREWQRKHKDKVKEYQERYWEKKARQHTEEGSKHEGIDIEAS